MYYVFPLEFNNNEYTYMAYENDDGINIKINVIKGNGVVISTSSLRKAHYSFVFNFIVNFRNIKQKLST